MAKHNLFLVLILFVTWISLAKSDGLENFVRAKMADYSTWLKTSYYDPSPIIAGPHLLQAYNSAGEVDIFIKNHVVQGHSNGISITHVQGSLSLGYFNVGFDIVGKLIFWGQHNTNGTVMNAIPVNVNGCWNITTENFSFNSLVIHFEELPTGFLSIVDYYMASVTTPTIIREVNFDNLSHGSGTCAETLQSSIGDQFINNYFLFSLLGDTHPLLTLYWKYWQDILKTTTLEEIIGTPPSEIRKK